LSIKTSKSVTLNFFSLSAGQAISQALNFIAIALAARYLGVINLGVFSSLLAIVIIASTFVDLGFAPIAFRQNSKENDFEIINTAISLRLIALVFCLLVFNLFVYFTSFDKLEALLLNLLAFNIVFSSKIINIRSLLEIPFKSSLIMKYPMFFNVVDNLILMMLVLLMPFIKAGLVYFVVVYLLSNLPGFFALLILLKKYFNFSLSFSTSKAGYLIKESLPIYGYVILSALYMQLDILIIRFLKTNYEVGIYSVSTRLTMPLNIIPAAISATVLPIILNNNENSEKKNESIYRFVSKLLYLISLAFAGIIAFRARDIVVILFGTEYASADFATIILAVTQVFIFFSFFAIELLSVCGGQKYTFAYAFVLLVAGLGFDFLLVPGYSLIGAAYAKLIASFAGFVYMMWVLKKSELNIFPTEWRLLLFSVSVLAVQYLLSFLPVFIYMFLSCLNFLLSIYITRYFNTGEISMILKLLNKEHWKDKFRI
jgi:O-antigen/teichoic acid export membrane protein